MKSVFSHNRGSSVVHFFPEEIASARNVMDVQNILSKKLNPSEKDFDPNTLSLYQIESQDPEEYWKSYKTVQANWILGATRLEFAFMKILNQGNFWYLDSEFQIRKYCLSDCRYVSLRHSIVQGNCFLTKREALLFQRKIKSITQLLRGLEETYLSEQFTRSDKPNMCYCSLVMNGSTSDNESSVNEHEANIQIRFKKFDRLQSDVNRCIFSFSFATAEYAAQACIHIESLFRSNSIVFRHHTRPNQL